MLRSWLAVLLIGTISTQSLLASRPAENADTPKKPTIQEKILDIPAGTIVEVRVRSTKEKLRGRMAGVDSDSFVVKVAKGAVVEDRKVPFSDVRSVKAQERGMSTATKVVLGALAGVGTLFLVLILIAAATGWD